MDKPSDLNWDDLRALLALSEQGSTTLAAHHLRVSHQTVARRITQLETAVGVDLVLRDTHPWRLTQVGKQMAAGSAKMRAELEALLAESRQQTSGMQGTVRITSVAWAFDLLILPALAALQAAHPALTFEFIADAKAQDLHGGAADLAFRFTDQPPEGLIGKRLGDVRFGLFGLPALIESYAAARAGDRPGPVRMIDLIDRPRHRPGLDLLGLNLTHVTRVSDFSTLVSAVQFGAGLAILPVPVGRALAGVVQSPLVDFPPSGLGMWLLKTRAARKSEKIRACENAILAHARHLLANRRPAP